MKVKVKDIKSNPYRNMEKYKIDRLKVETLKTSMDETGFWDNILLRESPTGGYELAYGHHRLEAIKEIGFEEIEVSVKPLDDATMLRIMANENLEAYNPTTVMINETVEAAKQFIDNELAKYETWEDFCYGDSSITNLVDTGHSFSKLKDNGAGRNVIKSFLGGNWSDWMVRSALALLNDDNIDREAVESFSTLEQARTFRETVNKHNIPLEEQKEVAEELIRDGNDSRRAMKRVFENIGKEYDEEIQEEPEEQEDEIDYGKEVVAQTEQDHGVDLDRAVENNVYAMRQIMTGLEEILANWEHVSNEARADYEKALSEFFHINKKYLSINGGEQWNELKLLK